MVSASLRSVVSLRSRKSALRVALQEQLLRREFPNVSSITFARKSSENEHVFCAWHGTESFDKSPATRTYELAEILF